jgi:predicted nucleotidyltransferase
LHEIKTQILKVLDDMDISVKQIVLFGSRARGNFLRDSDFDFLIITGASFDFKEKMQIAAAIRKKLAELYVNADIIINSEEEIKLKRNRIGCVTRYALKEGIKL